MVQDRGSIKWTSLMLPEHVELLKNIWKEDKRIAKPTLDEQELEMLNMRLIQAYHEKQLIHIDYYKDAQMIETSGIIKKLDQINHKVVLTTVNEELISIHFMDIYNVTW